MGRRRGWRVEAVAWAAATVLAVDVAVVWSGAIGERETSTAAAAEQPTPVTKVKETTVRVPKTQVMRKPGKQRPAAPRVAALGPPPGPQRDARPARTAAAADRYAFLVGVQDYRSPTKDTIGSANDVRHIRDVLLANGWSPANIKVVVDGQATGAAIRSGIAWLASKSQAGKTFSFFHYSGHVKQFGGQRDALWPVDRDWVRDTELAALLRQVRGRLWVDIAGCEAGSFIAGVASSSVLVSASSKATEKSYEYPPWRRSVWTGLLFDLAITQYGADADRDNRVTIGEALRYSTYYAQAITLNQRPYGRQTPQVQGDAVRGWTIDAPPA